MNHLSRRFSALAVLLLLTTMVVFAAVPQLINYQGYLTDSVGDPVADNTYSVIFSIYNISSGGSATWSCTTNVTTTDGAFEYILGSGCPLPDDLFTDTTRWLGIKVGADMEIIPRIRLTTTPYSYHSLRSDTAGYVIGGGTGPWTVVAGSIYFNGGNVGINNSAPGWPLDVDGDIRSSSTYRIGNEAVLRLIGTNSIGIGPKAGESSSGTHSTYAGYLAGRLNQANGNTYLGSYAGQISTTGVYNTFVGYGAGYDNVGGEFNTYVGSGAGWQATGSGNVFVGHNAGYTASGDNKLYIANSTADPLIYGDFESAQVGLGTTNPLAKLHVYTTVFDAIRGISSGDEGSSGVVGEASANYTFGVQGSASGTSGAGVYGHSNGNNGRGVLGSTSSTNGIAVFGRAENLAGGHGVYGVAEGDGGWGVYGYAAGDNGIGVYAKTDYEGAIALVVEGAPSAAWAADIKGNVRIKNQLNETIVELGEGLDYAEGFNTTDVSDIPPGTVMIIDPDNPGQLTVSNRPYDSRVAGIVSGAKGLGSGVRLGTDQFDIDVALAGRVYCYVDATTAGIQPGDLLTTSSTPGYAMKTTDNDRTRGAILGKAMQSLEYGQKGMILVLVTLQ